MQNSLSLPKHITLRLIPNVAQLIAQHLQGGEILALCGELGSGKTLFTKQLAKLLKVKTPVTSPTFTVMNHYHGHLLPLKKKVEILHLDLYRTKNLKEIRGLGLLELWGNKNTITIIEWAEKIKRTLPKHSIILKFKHE